MATPPTHRTRMPRRALALACLIALAAAHAQQEPGTDLLMHSMAPHALIGSDGQSVDTLEEGEAYDVHGGVYCIHPSLNEDLASTYINHGYLAFAADLARYETMRVCRFDNLTAATPIFPATGPAGARAQQTDPIAGHEIAEPVSFSFIRMQTATQTVWLTVKPDQVDQ